MNLNILITNWTSKREYSFEFYTLKIIKVTYIFLHIPALKQPNICGSTEWYWYAWFKVQKLLSSGLTRYSGLIHGKDCFPVLAVHIWRSGSSNCQDPDQLCPVHWPHWWARHPENVPQHLCLAADTDQHHNGSWDCTGPCTPVFWVVLPYTRG